MAAQIPAMELRYVTGIKTLHIDGPLAAAFLLLIIPMPILFFFGGITPRILGLPRLVRLVLVEITAQN